MQQIFVACVCLLEDTNRHNAIRHAFGMSGFFMHLSTDKVQLSTNSNPALALSGAFGVFVFVCAGIHTHHSVAIVVGSILYIFLAAFEVLLQCDCQMQLCSTCWIPSHHRYRCVPESLP